MQNPMNNLEIIILAAGKGTRMKSSIPKVLHPLGGKPIIEHVLETARSLKPKKIHLVLNKEIQNEFDHLKSKINLVIQKKQLGTGDAINMAIKSFQKKFEYSCTLWRCSTYAFNHSKTNN